MILAEMVAVNFSLLLLVPLPVNLLPPPALKPMSPYLFRFSATVESGAAPAVKTPPPSEMVLSLLVLLLPLEI